MTSSLLNLVNNLFEGLDRIKCTLGHDNKKCEKCGSKYKYCNCYFEYVKFKENLIEYKCLSCNKNYQQKFNKNLKKDFLTHTSCLTMITISLFYYYEKVFILTNIWMIGNNSMKRHYLKKKIFIVT